MNKGNTPIEVMAAIVENGGPVEAWVSNAANEDWFMRNVTGINLGRDMPFVTKSNSWRHCSLTNPHPQYKPIPTEWTNDWANCRAVDADGALWEYEETPIKTNLNFRCIVGRSDGVSEGHDPTNWGKFLERRPRKTRHMTPLEAFEFLAEGHEGKPRVWRRKNFQDGTMFAPGQWNIFKTKRDIRDYEYANLSDRDGDTLTWREFPMVEDKRRISDEIN